MITLLAVGFFKVALGVLIVFAAGAVAGYSFRGLIHRGLMAAEQESKVPFDKLRKS